MIVVLAELFYSKQFLQQLKRTPGLTWVPGIPPEFASYTREEMLNLISVLPDRAPRHEQSEVYDNEVPASFDWAFQRPECAGPSTVRNQLYCGSCYSFSSVNQLSDNRCIRWMDKKRVQYSEQYVVSCDTRSYGCQGGFLDVVQRFIKETGTVKNTCVPYTSGQTGRAGTCPTQCADNSQLAIVKSKNYKHISDSQSSIKSALAQGVIQASFVVYEDFNYYESGVYKHTYGRYDGMHAIMIVGYGEQNGLEYWKVKNSWGKSWGENGFFRIARGTNECSIEKDCWQMTP